MLKQDLYNAMFEKLENKDTIDSDFVFIFTKKFNNFFNWYNKAAENHKWYLGVDIGRTFDRYIFEDSFPYLMYTKFDMPSKSRLYGFTEVRSKKTLRKNIKQLAKETNVSYSVFDFEKGEELKEEDLIC